MYGCIKTLYGTTLMHVSFYNLMYLLKYKGTDQYLSFFSVVKYSDKSKLKEKRVYPGSQYKCIVQHGQEIKWQELKADGPIISTVRKQRAVNVGVQFCFPTNIIQNPRQRMLSTPTIGRTSHIDPPQ